MSRNRPSLGLIVYALGALALGLYFAFAAVQGDYGILKRAGVNAEARVLRAELETLEAEVARMENLTLRLSDKFLDLDLLDERARDVLGMIHQDEIILD